MKFNYSVAPYKFACQHLFGCVVDLGCGKMPYKEMAFEHKIHPCFDDRFDTYVTSYEGVDNKNPAADFPMNVEAFLFKVKSVDKEPDFYICFHSLYQFEHLWPVLKNSGKKGIVLVETNGANPIGNLWRRFTKKPKREGLFKQPPSDGEVTYFSFLAMLPLGRYWYPIAEFIDWFLLNDLGLHFLAWKFVYVKRFN